jgi:SAM-dependent methyltransferase
MEGYLEDLAYIHDVGFTEFARSASPGLLRILKSNGITKGQIVDLGCGSGRWALELNRTGYDVLGVDQSPAMIRLARKIAPRSRFQIASWLDANLPVCDAITSIGECLNYTFDERNTANELARFFRKAYHSLRRRGAFIFDVAEPGRVPNTSEKKWSEGVDWAVLVDIDGDRARKVLCRRIITFRKAGKTYRRSEETHRLRLYHAEDLVESLRQCGFRARKLTGYGRFRLPPGIAGVLAVKP